MTSKEEAINVLIEGCDTNKISDGYHTFGELYEHRIQLFLALLRSISANHNTWKSKNYSDGSRCEGGWFIAGIGLKPGTQISYHLPLSLWDECEADEILISAPEWDGHTSIDVSVRLGSIR